MARKQKKQQSEKRRAYVSVIDDAGKFRLGIAIEGEEGYYPLKPDSDLGGEYASKDEADRIAEDANSRLGLSREEASKIVISTMKFK